MTFRSIGISLGIAVVLLGASALITRNAASASVAIAAPVADDSLAAQSGQETAVVAGGCFWGIQLVFEHVKGVISATDGYSGRRCEDRAVRNGEHGDNGTRRIREDRL
jgi:peptide-methionine (S)-S-oxide reductase